MKKATEIKNREQRCLVCTSSVPELNNLNCTDVLCSGSYLI